MRSRCRDLDLNPDPMILKLERDLDILMMYFYIKKRSCLCKVSKVKALTGKDVK